MIQSGMEDTYTKHTTGYTCSVCGGDAVAEIVGNYLCGNHAIDYMTLSIDLRKDETASVEV